jgi:acyl-CoA thioesterase I
LEQIVNFFGGGYAFFGGVLGIFAGMTVFVLMTSRWRTPLGTLLAVLGLVVIVLSATPLPYALYAVAAAATIYWLIVERRGSPGRRWIRGLVAGIWLVAVAIEIPYWLPPYVPKSDRPTLYVIGDSVSAGLDDTNKNVWPAVLARKHDIDVVNFAVAGATVESAFPQAKQLPDSGGLVLLEIGGNDLLGQSTNRFFGGMMPGEFEHDLDALLTRVCVPDRTVLMMELPLPPFSNEFGRIQRQLAAKHGVRLIPKRVFIGVLTGDRMTIDGIHLTKRGHERMADVIWETIRGAYGK